MDPATFAIGLQAAKTASVLGKKYAPQMKRVVNHLVHSGGPKSALKYLNNLRTPKGMSKFIRKDARKGFQKASRAISSGRALRAVHGVVGDIASASQAMGDAAAPHGGSFAMAVGDAARQTGNFANSVGKGTSQLMESADSARNTAGTLADVAAARNTHFHQTVEHLNRPASNHIKAFKTVYG